MKRRLTKSDLKFLNYKYRKLTPMQRRRRIKKINEVIGKNTKKQGRKTKSQKANDFKRNFKKLRNKNK